MERKPNPLLKEIKPGESVIWEGKPEVWPFVTMGPLHMVLFISFSLLWGGFFIFWEIQMIQEKSIIGALFGAPFLLFGLYLMVGRFWVGVRCWKNTFYAVTDRRVLIRLGAFRLKVTSLELSTISSVTLQMKRSRIGHINFGKLPVFDTIYIWQPGPSWSISKGLVVTVPSFRYIREPEKIHKTICSLLKAPER